MGEKEQQQLEYRIVCNSEHFVVLNPVKRKPESKKNGEGEQKPRKTGTILIRK